MRFSRSVGFGLVMALALAQGSAHAACALGTIQGKWKAYSSGSDRGATYWRSCLINISANGTITNPSCLDSIGSTLTATQGKVQLQSGANCAYSATFRFAGQNNRVDNMTLSRDRETVYGVGSFPGGHFIFSMVKI